MKKNEERYYLSLFKKYYSNFPVGEIYESECPDFLIKQNDKAIGIELTKIFQIDNSSKISSQAKDSIQDDIVDRIRSMLIKNKLNNYEVHLAITIHNHLIKKERIKIASKIFEILKSNLPNNNYYRIENDFNNLKSFPEQVSSISIIHLPELDTPFVSSSKYGWVQKDMISELKDILLKKNDRLSVYKNNCQEYWLIIHTSSFSSGCFFEPSAETLNYTYHSNFDKLFFLNSFDCKIYELKRRRIERNKE